MKKTPAEELLIGAHLSAAGGVHKALLRGHAIGATTLQLFTANQRQWASSLISEDELKLWHAALAETGLKKLMSHSSYLINLGTLSEENHAKSLKAFGSEIKRCHQLHLDFLNFHPGAAGESSEESCLQRIIDSLLSLAYLTDEGKTRLLLEATAGQGSSVGHKFEHLAVIIEGVQHKVPIGVCIDTCHIFAAGYDVRNKKAWHETIDEFDHIVGLKHLYALHVNDSVHDIGSRKDRHACLGKGKIGIEGFEAMMQHPKLRELPKYLETPLGEEVWREEIALLREFAK